MDREAIWEKVRHSVISHYVYRSVHRGDVDWVTFDPECTADVVLEVSAILRKHKGEEARLLAVECLDDFIYTTAEKHADTVMENRGNELVAEWGKDED